MHNSNATGNIAKWAAEFQLDFQPRHAVKSQILADFIAEWTPSPSNSGGPDFNAGPSEPEVRTPVFTEPHWTLRYAVVEGDLYRRGANGILMRCISQEEGRELLAEIHGGECGSHSSSRTLVGKAFRHGFYWPTALQDAAELVRSCKAC